MNDKIRNTIIHMDVRENNFEQCMITYLDICKTVYVDSIKRLSKDDELLISNKYYDIVQIQSRTINTYITEPDSDEDEKPKQRRHQSSRIAIGILKRIIYHIGNYTNNNNNLVIKSDNATSIKKFLKKCGCYEPNLELDVLRSKGFMPPMIDIFRVANLATSLSKSIGNKEARIYGANIHYCILISTKLIYGNNSDEFNDIMRWLILPTNACIKRIDKLISAQIELSK